jgi:DnaJ-class molecular chaperone
MVAPALGQVSLDLYAILEVERSASARQIRSAYRRLARVYHPDRNADEDAAQHFKAIAEAYSVLSDTSRRAAYDQWGHISTNGTAVIRDDDGDFAFE